MKNTFKFLAIMILSIIINNLSNAQWFTVDPPPTNYNLKGVQLVSSTVGYAVGDSGTILKTTDGGTTWDTLSSGTTNDLISLSFTDENTGTVVGSFQTILRTTDGGLKWIPQTISNFWPYSVSFIDSNHGLVGGGSSQNNFDLIYRTTDGGENWIYCSGEGGLFVSDIFYLDSVNAVASNIHWNWLSGFLKSSDGGATWTEIYTLNTLNELSFINSDIGIAVGTEGFIVKTKNAGIDWTTQSSNTIKDLYSVSFTNLIYGTAVGEAGTILRTTNGGEDWTAQSSGTSFTLNSVSFIDENTGIVVGANGTILRTSNGGVTFVNDENYSTQPKDFILLQNYPNPFNPSTTIRYSIPSVIASGTKQSSFVTLKVYDVLGNEVATLVNEEKPAGSYEVEFTSHSGSVRNLSSGVYLYTLQAGSFIQTKKFILMK
jgi:photosystem II stability/assembly factor-like uncharacterized protein